MVENISFFISKREYDELHAKRMALKTEWQKTQHELGNVVAGSSSFVNKTPGFDETEMHLHRLEEQIDKVDNLLGKAILLASIKQLDSKRVTIYSLVETENQTDGKETTYYLQHQFASAPGKIIVTPASPIGRQLLGHRVGDEITVNLPENKLHLKITKIKKAL